MLFMKERLQYEKKNNYSDVYYTLDRCSIWAEDVQ